MNVIHLEGGIDMTELEKQKIEDYKKFMYNPNNIKCCDICPENNGFDNRQDRLPCGQYRCWVKVHCEN